VQQDGWKYGPLLSSNAAVTLQQEIHVTAGAVVLCVNTVHV
jgi:hypothetical protein